MVMSGVGSSYAAIMSAYGSAGLTIDCTSTTSSPFSPPPLLYSPADSLNNDSPQLQPLTTRSKRPRAESPSQHAQTLSFIDVRSLPRMLPPTSPSVRACGPPTRKVKVAPILIPRTNTPNALTPMYTPSPSLSAYTPPPSISPLPTPLSPVPFTALAAYRIVRSLHVSLFGSVLHAVECATGINVAVKMIRHTTTPSASNRVCTAERETAVLRHITQHKSAHIGARYLPAEFRSVRDQTYDYIITRFAASGDLYALIERSPMHRCTETVARRILSQLCSAVEYLHSALRVAHLDLSLENVCLDGAGDVVLVDFGLSVITTDKTRRQRAAPAGKRAYQSPEMLADAEFDPFAADVFAIGVLAYQLMTGHPPFIEASAVDCWYQTITTGRWMHDDVITQSAANVYSHLSRGALTFIDAAIKPHKTRADMAALCNQPFLHQEDRNGHTDDNQLTR